MASASRSHRRLGAAGEERYGARDAFGDAGLRRDLLVLQQTFDRSYRSLSRSSAGAIREPGVVPPRARDSVAPRTDGC